MYAWLVQPHGIVAFSQRNDTYSPTPGLAERDSSAVSMLPRSAGMFKCLGGHQVVDARLRRALAKVRRARTRHGFSSRHTRPDARACTSATHGTMNSCEGG